MPSSFKIFLCILESLKIRFDTLRFLNFFHAPIFLFFPLFLFIYQLHFVIILSSLLSLFFLPFCVCLLLWFLRFLSRRCLHIFFVFYPPFCLLCFFFILSVSSSSFSWFHLLLFYCSFRFLLRHVPFLLPLLVWISILFSVSSFSSFYLPPLFSFFFFLFCSTSPLFRYRDVRCPSLARSLSVGFCFVIVGLAVAVWPPLLFSRRSPLSICHSLFDHLPSLLFLSDRLRLCHHLPSTGCHMSPV